LVLYFDTASMEVLNPDAAVVRPKTARELEVDPGRVRPEKRLEVNVEPTAHPVPVVPA
jgi:hypothetical protein